jgi:hypothetical protein
VEAVGIFGSYARGDWGVGSDLDVIVIVGDSTRPFIERALEWDASDLPVPTDLLVYTRAEWSRLPQTNPSFARRLRDDVVWILT